MKKIIIRMAKGEDKEALKSTNYIKRVLSPFKERKDKRVVVLRLKDGTQLGKAMLVKRQRPAYQDWLASKKNRNIPMY